VQIIFIEKAGPTSMPNS